MPAETYHTFEGRESDWGFTQFVQLSEIQDPAKGFIQEGRLSIQVKIKVEHPDSYLYNSKRETGFVGLKNQGATCYMNSLLQTLYNINYFRQVDTLPTASAMIEAFCDVERVERSIQLGKTSGVRCPVSSHQTCSLAERQRKMRLRPERDGGNSLQAVYHMPTSEEELPSRSIPLALQSLFFKVQVPAIRDTLAEFLCSLHSYFHTEFLGLRVRWRMTNDPKPSNDPPFE